MATNFFIELSIIIIVAVTILTLTRLLRQPLILGYILTGILFSPSFFNIIKSTEVISTFSEIGIALLLFLVGLNLNPKIIKKLGLVSLITGVGQVLFTSIIGFFIARALGFAFLPAIYISIALTFSSTIIIMKLLSDKGELDKLHGKIAIGFLIIQDLIAVFALMAISSLSDETISLTSFATKTFVTGGITIVVLFLAGFYILPKITKYIARSQEFLLLFSLGWCFAIATLFAVLGFSIEIGALLAGITLSISPYKIEISSKLRPIRDFFLFLFFIWLGLQMSFADISTQWPGIIIFSLFILIGNPLIVMVLMGMMKYKKQTSFLAGLTVAQISEFSLILIALGVKVGHLTPEILSFVTLIGIITIAGSSYLIVYSHRIYPLFAKSLSVFERKEAKEGSQDSEQNDIIMFGANRTGHEILSTLKKNKAKVLIVDYDPETIEKLSKKGYKCIYGDITDPELLLDIDVCSSKMIISTVAEVESNILFIKRLKLCNPKAIIITTTDQAEDALLLYQNGADYVILPHHLGGKYAAQLIDKNKLSKSKFTELKDNEIPEIKKLLRGSD
jgi:Kef-type K+ transport system membrane component KefB